MPPVLGGSRVRRVVLVLARSAVRGWLGRTVGLFVVAWAIGCRAPAPCGAPGAVATGRGLRRGAETVAAMAELGLAVGARPEGSDVFLLGYPNLGLAAIA